jgi:hypothetical protein
MTTYTRRGPGQSYLKSVLAERINSLIEHKDLNLEINPVKVCGFFLFTAVFSFQNRSMSKWLIKSRRRRALYRLICPEVYLPKSRQRTLTSKPSLHLA